MYHWFVRSINFGREGKARHVFRWQLCDVCEIACHG